MIGPDRDQHNMVGHDRPSARFHNEAMSPDGAPEPPSPDGVNSAQLRVLVGNAMAKLSAEHRAVVRRSYYQGWTTAYIAADLGISDGTVKSRLHYALRTLRQTLQEMG